MSRWIAKPRWIVPLIAVWAGIVLIPLIPMICLFLVFRRCPRWLSGAVLLFVVGAILLSAPMIIDSWPVRDKQVKMAFEDSGTIEMLPRDIKDYMSRVSKTDPAYGDIFRRFGAVAEDEETWVYSRGATNAFVVVRLSSKGGEIVRFYVYRT